MRNENKVVLPEPVAAESRFTSFSGDRWKWCTVEHAQAFGQDKGYEVRYLYTEQQVRALLATATGLPAHVCKDSTPQLHVGDSSFEGWYAGYVKEGTVSLKQNCRDAYAAGMGDPLVVAAPQQADARDAQITWPKARDVGRIGDMSPSAHMRVGFDSDNDVCVSVWNENGGGSIEFCNPGGGGGGKSSSTRMALIALMVAMEADNAEKPSLDWWAQRASQAAQHGGAA